MTIREASFGDMFRIAFWVQLGPALIGLTMIGVMLSATVLIVPELPGQLVGIGLLPAEAASGPLVTIGAIWIGVLTYMVVTAVFASLRSLSGAVLLVSLRRVFLKRRIAAELPPIPAPAE